MTAESPPSGTEALAAANAPAPRGGLLKALGGITALNAGATALAFFTSPLQARALGPAGRGELAAIAVTFGLVPVLADIGLMNFAARETARGVSPRRLIGSLVPLALCVGLVVAALSPFIARIVAGDRSNVYVLVLIGLLLMPVFLASTILSGINWGREDWKLWSLVRIISPLGIFITYVTLYATGHLTVTTGGITIIGVAVVAVLPLLPILRQGSFGRRGWDAGLAREAMSFGSRVWLTTIAMATASRLDQLLMTRLVPSTELGLYVVAVNISMLGNVFLSAALSTIYPRVSRGDHTLAARAHRLVLLATVFGSAVLIAIVGWAIPVVFGAGFEGAVPMARLLLLAAIPQAGVLVLSTVLMGAGHPGMPGRAQVLSLVVTIPLLIALLGSTGGKGAAAISLGGYAMAYLYLLHATRRQLGLGLLDMFVVRRADLSALDPRALLRRGR